MNSNDLAPVLVIGIVMLLPIIKVLINHQQKMAELIHRTDQQTSPRHEELRQELQDLKQLVHQQAIAIDNISSKLDSAKGEAVQDRLSGVQS